MWRAAYSGAKWSRRSTRTWSGRCRSTRCAFAIMTMRRRARAGRRRRGCCSSRRTTTSAGASWLATGGGTSRRPPGHVLAPVCSSIARTASPCGSSRTSASGRLAKRPIGSSVKGSAIPCDHVPSSGETLCGRRQPGRDDGLGEARGDPRVHREPDADAPGRGDRLRALCARRAARDSRSADLVRSLLGRARRDGTAGAADCRVGRECVREDPGDQHEGAPVERTALPAVARGRESERDGRVVAATGPRDCRRARRRRAVEHLDLRGAHRRYRARPGAVDAGGPGDGGRRALDRAHLGEPARNAQRVPGGPGRLPHHHGDRRHPRQAGPGRQGPRGVLARDGPDVPQRRDHRRVRAVGRRTARMIGAPARTRQRDKIVAVGDLPGIRERFRDRRIIHCHGAFDLVHLGHLTHFEEAREMGDLLVVTLTGDAHITKKRSVTFSEDQRARQVAALEIVDYVAVTQEPTALSAIEALHPDVYVKGPEYADLTLDKSRSIYHEMRVLESYGGKMHFTSGEPFSSTNLSHFLLAAPDAAHRDPLLRNDRVPFQYMSAVAFPLDQLKQFIAGAVGLKVCVIGETITDEWVDVELTNLSTQSRCVAGMECSRVTQVGGVGIIARPLANFVSEVHCFTNGPATDAPANVRHTALDAGALIETRFVEAGRPVFKTKSIGLSCVVFAGLPRFADSALLTISAFRPPTTNPAPPTH